MGRRVVPQEPLQHEVTVEVGRAVQLPLDEQAVGGVPRPLGKAVDRPDELGASQGQARQIMPIELAGQRGHHGWIDVVRLATCQRAKQPGDGSHIAAGGCPAGCDQPVDEIVDCHRPTQHPFVGQPKRRCHGAHPTVCPVHRGGVALHRHEERYDPRRRGRGSSRRAARDRGSGSLAQLVDHLGAFEPVTVETLRVGRDGGRHVSRSVRQSPAARSPRPSRLGGRFDGPGDLPELTR